MKRDQPSWNSDFYVDRPLPSTQTLVDRLAKENQLVVHRGFPLIDQFLLEHSGVSQPTPEESHADKKSSQCENGHDSIK